MGLKSFVELLINPGLGIKAKDQINIIATNKDTIIKINDSIIRINKTIIAKSITLDRILKKLDGVYIHDTIRIHDTVYITRDSTILSIVDSTKWLEEIDRLNSINNLYLTY